MATMPYDAFGMGCQLLDVSQRLVASKNLARAAAVPARWGLRPSALRASKSLAAGE